MTNFNENTYLAPLPPIYQWEDHEDLFPPSSWINGIPSLNTFVYNFRLFFTLFAASRVYRKYAHKREYFWRSSYTQMNHVLAAGAEIHIEGLEHVKALNGKPVVFIGNHMSLLETFLLPCLLLTYTDPVFVVKESLLNAPFLGIILQKQDSIAVGRSNPREDLKAVLEQGQERLKNNKSMVIFPQSTRQIEFDPAEFSSIGVKLAAKAGVQVVPIALRTDFLINGKMSKDIGAINPEKPPVHFAFGAPIDVEGNGKDAHEKVVAFITEHLQKWNVPVKKHENS